MTPTFDAAFRERFRELVLWRRDVRRFRPDPIDPARIDALLTEQYNDEARSGAHSSKS